MCKYFLKLITNREYFRQHCCPFIMLMIQLINQLKTSTNFNYILIPLVTVMGNMCQENKEISSSPRKLRDKNAILTQIRTSFQQLDYYNSSEQETDDIQEFPTLTSINTPSYDFDHLKITKNKKNKDISQFKVIRVLGKGSFGKVMLVEDSTNNRLYAMKILQKKSIKTKQDKMHTLSQRHILEVMDHQFVVKLHFAFQNSKKLYLLVDFLSGGELFYLLRRSGKFSQDTARFYAAELLLAIQYLHSKNIIYRDIKPQNILLDREGHIKITDFGLSKVCHNQGQKTYSMCGTPQYIAPEVIIGKGYTKSADWFSFGSVLYDMLTGKPPFYNKNKNQMLKNLVSKDVPLPDYLSDDAKSLFSSLFKIIPSQRLGDKKDATEIKAHAFFQKINFDNIKNKTIKPPFSFPDSINPNGFDTKLQLKIPLDSMQQDKKLGELYDNFTYQKSCYSDQVLKKNIENSKTFTLDIVQQ